jgi:hypothetical protein
VLQIRGVNGKMDSVACFFFDGTIVWLVVGFYLSFHGWTLHLKDCRTGSCLSEHFTRGNCLVGGGGTLEIVQSVGMCAQIFFLLCRLSL